MTQKIKIIVSAAAFVLLLAGAMIAYNTLRGSVNPEIILAEQPGSISNPQEESTSPDEEPEPEMLKAPDFTVEDLEGNSVKLSDMEGKPVVLNFWASWCSPCKAEMPEFDSVYAELGSDVTFMMVNMTDGDRETKEKGAAYVYNQGFSFPVYYDTNQEGSYAYGIRSIPTTLFIDSSGYIITGAEGQLDEKTLRYGISLIYTKEDTEANKITAAKYHKISADEAKIIIDGTESFILLDVRTDDEYREQHISGAVLIPDYEISVRAEAELPNKDALILVYCRSGRRSALAANELVGLGYNNVYDFGGIIDWSYETE